MQCTIQLHFGVTDSSLAKPLDAREEILHRMLSRDGGHLHVPEQVANMA